MESSESPEREEFQSTAHTTLTLNASLVATTCTHLSTVFFSYENSTGYRLGSSFFALYILPIFCALS